MIPSPRTSLGDRIRATIEDEIAKGTLQPGTRLDEQSLMARFEVSRTPAREALLQLASAGLVTSVPRHGAVVAGISLTDYVAMLEILVELEGLAARLAARRMPAELRDALQAAAQACETAAAADDANAYGEANRRFHEALYDGARNDVLARQLRAMRTRMGHPRHTVFDRPGRLRQSLAEHRQVLDAVLDGDEDTAHAAMIRHISSGGNVFADTIASLTRTA